MELENTLLETIYLACNRASVSEALASIPGDELPRNEDFKNMIIRFTPEEDVAWGDDFPTVAMWLAKREHDRREKERNHPRKKQGDF